MFSVADVSLWLRGVGPLGSRLRRKRAAESFRNGFYSGKCVNVSAVEMISALTGWREEGSGLQVSIIVYLFLRFDVMVIDRDWEGVLLSKRS